MAQIDEGALQMEIDALSQPAETDASPEAQPEPVDMFEIPVGDQTYKIPLNTELPIKHNGQIVKAPLEKVLNAWRQGAQLQDKYTKFNTDQQKLKEQMGDLDSFNQQKTKFGAIQDWSEKNPEQWDKLWQMYENKDQHLLGGETDQNSAMINEISGLKKQLSELDSFRQDTMKAQEEAQIQADVKEIEQEIEQFSKQHPDFQMDSTDEEGLTLKARIIQHGLDGNLPTFRQAALSYLEPQLFKAAEDRGRTETVKAVKSDKAAGILGRSSTPSTGQGEMDPRRLGEEELQETALAELQQLINNSQGG